MVLVDLAKRLDVLGIGVLSFIAYTFVTLVFFWSLIALIKRQRMVQIIEKIPGPKALPILGNALDVNVPPLELFRAIVGGASIWQQRGFPMYRVWAGPEPLLILHKASVVEICIITEGDDAKFMNSELQHGPLTILTSQKHISKSRDYDLLHPWLGLGLLTSTGKPWHSRRKLLTPAFHFKILEDFVEVFNKQSKKLVHLLKAKAEASGKEAFNVFPPITHCTLDIICETAMGRSLNAMDNSDSEYVKAVYRIGAMVQMRQARPWLRPDLLFNLFGYGKEHNRCLNVLHKVSLETIRERRAEFEAAKKLKEDTFTEDDGIGIKKRLAFLDLLLEYSDNGRVLSEKDIREEVDTFMFEGHDTTAAGINWCLYLLGRYPEAQERIYEELGSIFGDSNRDATMDDLRQMKYLECCIKEAQRIFPSVPFIGRSIEEDLVIDGYHVPSGTMIMIMTYQLHRDPEQFPEPEVFDPDRFLPENAAKRHPYAYVPFSAGPRNCIGQKFALLEEKVVISTIVKNFTLKSVTRHEDLKILGELILRPQDGNFIVLTPRVTKVEEYGG